MGALQFAVSKECLDFGLQSRCTLFHTEDGDNNVLRKTGNAQEYGGV